ncbi:hypothetical protein GCM10011600_11800 [Pseudolysinimonas yzui]|uniref:Uncharacterized protein n=1 Tax=Pseudolysinimonas yzui TaxID=2708254 RepID=A0A8J3GPM9_9MICO|nr:hypothetical protein GCM10011600_11800 [Pseudolysinimonas yzui]
MKPIAPHSRRPRWPLILAIIVPPSVLVAVLIPSLSNPGPTTQDMWVGATPFGPTSEASAGEVEIIHEALHDIGAQCAETDPDLRAIAAHVDRIIEFSQRYPVGRFPIDDETATASSLLLVTREAVKTCAPAEVARIDAARQ